MKKKKNVEQQNHKKEDLKRKYVDKKIQERLKEEGWISSVLLLFFYVTGM